ncbi:DNA damage checkpoint control protein [Terramyces sp. JEL0728]|nr:DNA damage checkpoint control protein [Terramyces sp. JEL0728]
MDEEYDGPLLMPPPPHSYFLKPKTIFIIRFILTVFCFIWTVTMLSQQGLYYFWFYTHFNWVLNFIFFAIATYQSYMAMNNSELSRFWNEAFMCFFANTLTQSWLVTVIFWSLIAGQLFSNDSAADIAEGSISHVFNLLLPVFDLYLTTSDFPIVYMPYSFLYSINGNQKGISWGPMIGFLFGVLSALLLFYGVTLLLIMHRNYLGERKHKLQPSYTHSKLRLVDVGVAKTNANSQDQPEPVFEVLEKLDKQWVLCFSETQLSVIVLNNSVNSRIKVWANLSVHGLFEEYQIKSLHQNMIFIQLCGEHFVKALKSAQSSISVTMKLTRRELPYLSLTITNQSRTGKHLQLVQDIPVKVIPPSSAVDLGEPEMPDPTLSLQFPPIIVLKKLIEKMKNLANTLTISATTNGVLEFEIQTEMLSVCSKYKDMQIYQDATQNSAHVKVDIGDFIKFIQCYQINPNKIVCNIMEQQGIVLTITLDHILHSSDPAIELCYYLPCKYD